jgi:hypothetical protein
MNNIVTPDEEPVAERCGRVVNTPVSFSGDPGFKSRPVDRLS